MELPMTMVCFLHHLTQSIVLTLLVSTEAIFRFNCFNVEDSHDPEVGLEFGELAISGKVLKTEVFDPVIGKDYLSP